MWYLRGHKHIDKWNRREDTELEPYKCTEPTFDREAKQI